MLRIAILGCGSIGQRHARNLVALGEGNIVVFDACRERAEGLASALGSTCAASLDQVFVSAPEVVFVCTPPHLHIDAARQAVATGAHVFIEKPIANSLDGVADFISEARAARRVAYVGYNLRFHAGLRRMKELLGMGAIGRTLMIRAEAGQYLPDWRPGQDYRTGYITSRSTGGGIILDASHEIDYLRWLSASDVSRVYCAADHLSDLEMETEDSASMILRMENGILGELHLDCVQRGYTKTCKVIGSEGTLVWEFRSGVRLIRSATHIEDFPIVPDTNEMYLEELRHFLECVRGNAVPLVDAESGLRVLEAALAAKRSAESRQEVQVS